MHPFCGGLLSQQGGSDPIRGSGQAVYTLEVYTLLYSYISVKFVSLLIIARAYSCDVGRSLVLGCSPYTLKTSDKNERLKSADRVFLLGMILSSFESGALHCLQPCLETVVCCIAPGGLLWKQHWRTAVNIFVLQSDILMIQYWCNAL